MTTGPGPALSFYLAHGSDVAALRELESLPEGVSSSDWTKFQRVVAMANEEVAELLQACLDAILEGLGDAIVPVGRGPKRQTLASNWDAWREFKSSGNGGKVSLGWVGANLDVRDDEGGCLGGYLRLRSPRMDLGEALGAQTLSSDQLTIYTPDTALLVEMRVTSETDLAQVARALGEQFSNVRGALRAYLDGPAAVAL